MILLMYLLMLCEIVFPKIRDRNDIVINKIISVSGEHSWKNLTDTATIKLQSKTYFQGKKIPLKDFIKRGDPVTITIGYSGNMRKEFEGFVASVSPKIPIEITCEDRMYLLKHTSANISYESVMLPKLLNDICPAGTKIDALNTNLGSFKIVKANVAKVLEKTKQQYGFVAYFKGDVLKVGKVYFDSVHAPKPVAVLNFRKNIRSSNLTYREKEDVKIKVKAISNLRSGKKIEVEVGDKDGEERTLNYFNITEKEDLKAAAERDIDKLKVAGYRGKIKCYGLPVIDHTEIVTIEDPDYPEKNGNYYVDAVSWEFSDAGYTREYDIGSITT